MKCADLFDKLMVEGIIRRAYNKLEENRILKLQKRRKLDEK